MNSRITIPVFAYGSNLDEDQMGRRCPESFPTYTATLPGYRLAFAGNSIGWGGGVATVVRDPSSAVPGVIYEVTLADLADLDRCEGHPFVYRRGSVPVILADGSSRVVQTYQRNANPSNGPSRDYLETIACAYSRLGFDEDTLAEAALRSAGGGRPVAEGETLVFVYGSLMVGLGNHGLLARGGARLVRDDVTERSYTMVDLGSFPGVIEGGSSAIRGEVWAVDARCLAALDQLEGHPDFYHRASVSLRSTQDAEAYFLPPQHGRVGSYGRTVPSGDWRGYQERRRWWTERF